MDWDMCNMAAKTKSCCHCLLQTLQYIRAQGHVQFPSFVVPKPTWQSVVQPAPAGHHPLPLASLCARRGTPEVRLWLVSIMSLCLWQARAPAVERPRCAFGCLCLPCLHVMSLCLWQARAPAVERPRCAFGSCPSCPFAFGKPVRPPWNARGAPLARVHHVPLPLASPCARCGTPEVRLWLSVFALSPCHVPLPLASPCARRGTPEVRLWLSVFVPCLHVMLLPRLLDIYVVTWRCWFHVAL